MALVVKNPPANAGNMRRGFNPCVRKIPGGGHGNPLRYPCLENPMDKEAWWAMSIGFQRVRHDHSDLAYRTQ